MERADAIYSYIWQTHFAFTSVLSIGHHVEKRRWSDTRDAWHQIRRRQRHCRVDAVDGAVVPRERPRLREGCLADLAGVGPDADVAPVVYDQTCAFDENAVAPWELADEMSHESAKRGLDQLDLLVRARGHRLQAGISLARLQLLFVDAEDLRLDFVGAVAVTRVYSAILE